MVGFSLAEITGKAVDTAEERVERMTESFRLAVEAFLDLRFADAHRYIAEIGAEVNVTKVYLALHGYATEDGQDASSDPSERGDRG